MRRRDAVRLLGAAPLVGCASALAASGPTDATTLAPRRSRVRHSVTRWSFGAWSLEELCQTAAELGIDSVELVQPSDAEVLARHGLTCAMTAHPPEA
ncbi:MAG: hydroxypyruvate isomerase, partial [Bacteroidota bacterium]